MTKDTKLFHLPDTLADWSWPRMINSHYEECKKESNAWLQSFKAFSPQSQYAFEKCDFALLAALVYPCASEEEHLRIGCDLMNLLFVIDEYTDVEQESAVQEIVDVAIDAIRNPNKPRPAGEVVLGEIARQFWTLAMKSASQTSQNHMVESFTEYLGSLVEEARLRDTGHACQSVACCLKNRRLNVGARPSFLILELDMALKDEVFYHPAVTELTQHITDLIIIDNDMVSYNKEQAVGDDQQNIIVTAMNEFNVDLEGAMRWAADYHRAVQLKFLDDLQCVSSWGSDIDRQVGQYIRGLAIWARGNHCWSYEGGRYFGDRGPEYQRTRLVPLIPKTVPFRENASNRREKVVVPLIEALEAKA